MSMQDIIAKKAAAEKVRANIGDHVYGSVDPELAAKAADNKASGAEPEVVAPTVIVPDDFMHQVYADVGVQLNTMRKSIDEDIDSNVAALTSQIEDLKVKMADKRRVIVMDSNENITFESEMVVHSAFEPVLRRIKAGLNVMLVGPTQSGKTTLAMQVSEALGRPFSANSMSAGTKESDLFGWLLPTGAGGTFEYHPAPFVNVFMYGGIQLFDEMDAADPNLLLAANMPIANRRMFIPHRLTGQDISAHPDFAAIAACNTWGSGADMEYVGRNQLDAATLARFVKVEVDYDPIMEAMLYEENAVIAGQVIRANIRKSKLRRVLTSNTMKQWSLGQAGGISLNECIDDYFKGWTGEEKRLAMLENKSALEASTELNKAAQTEKVKRKGNNPFNWNRPAKYTDRPLDHSAASPEMQEMVKNPMASLFAGLGD